jgi:adenine-specific DNA-methyltransferase
LIAEDPKSAEIIRPILRGRDIKRYSYDFANLYIITTFPSLKIDIEEYPAVKQHLLTFGYNRLKQTGDVGARKKTNNQWFETQDSISYWDDLNSQKIIWGEISDKTKFCIDLDGKFLNEATTFLMTGNSLLYLLGILNSKLSEYLFSKIGTTTGVGTVRWKKFTIEQLPVPFFKVEDRKVIEQMVRRIVENSDNFNFKDIENEINHKIYELLDFTIDEINFIESQYNQ